MIFHPGLYRATSLGLLVVSGAFAVDTHVWEQSDQSDFTRGTAKKLSIRSDGHVMLAPQFKELDSTTVPYLWAVAQDSKGVLYYAGGAPTGVSTKIYSLTPGGKPEVFADLQGLETHSLAIDSQDRVYAAVLPDAKIYRIVKGEKPSLFYDAKCKYIWAMSFDHSGNLFVATGDSGVVYKVTPNGEGSKFFDTGETHARSMILDSQGNLIVGTEPGGLIFRITPDGKGFVLFQANKREVTALAERSGVLYAAAVGNKPSTITPVPAAPQTPAPAAQRPPTQAGPAAGAHTVTSAPAALPPPVNSLTPGVSGGSELYRIEKDGSPERIWNSVNEVIYAIAFDASGKPLLGTGNKGIVQRIDSEQISTVLLNTPPTQVTSFLEGKNGVVYATTGNVGNLYAIGPGTETSGSFESEVLDANEFAYWGKAHVTAELRGGTISLETRSGNLNRPENNWSPWSKVDISELGGQVHSQPARFLQYKLQFSQSKSGESPDLSVVDLAYLPKNIAPKLQQIEIAPFNYRQAPSNSLLERSVQPSGSPTSLILPAVGQKRTASGNLETGGGAATLQYNKGFLTIRWSATDTNGDSMLFKVELRGKQETQWRLLKDKLADRYFAFDTASFPDGKYVVRVTASDAPGNTPAGTLTSSLESDGFTIDNTPAEITVTANGNRTARFRAADALSWIDKADYSVDGGEWILLTPDNSVTDSQTLEYTVKGEPGQLIALRIYDENDNVAVKQVVLK